MNFLVLPHKAENNNYFYHLWPDPDENLKNKYQEKILNILIVTSNKLYFRSLHERFKCTVVLPFYKSGNAWVKYLIVVHAPPY